MCECVCVCVSDADKERERQREARMKERNERDSNVKSLEVPTFGDERSEHPHEVSDPPIGEEGHLRQPHHGLHANALLSTQHAPETCQYAMSERTGQSAVGKTRCHWFIYFTVSSAQSHIYSITRFIYQHTDRCIAVSARVSE